MLIMGSTRCGQPRCRSIVGRGLLKVFCKVGRSSASTSLPRYYVGPLNTESGASTVAMQVVLVQMAFSRQLVHMFVLRNARYTCTIACTNSGLPCYSAILLAPPLRRGPCRQFYWFHRGEPAKSRSWTLPSPIFCQRGIRFQRVRKEHIVGVTLVFFSFFSFFPE